MFIQVNERPLNVYSVLYYYTREIVKDNIISYGLYYRITDGRVLEEIFESEEARDLKVEELGTATLGGLVQENTYADFPDRGSKEIIYLAKDTGQMWVWDEALGQYEKIGVSRKGGVYQYSQDLPSTIGSTVEIAKTDLDVIIEPSVPFMDGSEITAHNAIRGIITKSTNTTVTVRTIADMVIDSFVQVANEASLPAKGELNILYYIKDIDTFATWTGTAFDLKTTTVLITEENLNNPETLKKLSHAYKRFRNNKPYHVLLRYKSLGYTGGFVTVPVTFVADSASSFNSVSMQSAVYFYSNTANDNSNPGLIYKLSCTLNETNGLEITKITMSYDDSMSVSIGNKEYEVDYILRMNNNRSYSVLSDNQPAHKKYVDTADNTLRAELNTNIENLRTETETNLQEFKDEVHTTYSIFDGSEKDYEALTQEQKDAYFLAIVNPLAKPTEQELQTVNTIIGANTETIVDLTDEELEESVDTIIGGVQ